MRTPAKAVIQAAALSIAVAAPLAAGAQLDDILQGKSLLGQTAKGLAVAYAVRQSSKQLDKFINLVALRNHVPQSLATKVVPILSVGERGYIGGAQVCGPRDRVEKVQVCWQYEQGWNRGEYRVKALVPSASLNPLQLKRVEGVGMSALIDVSLGGGFPGSTRSGRVDATRVIRAAAVAGAVLVAAQPLNQFINTITFNHDHATKVVPQASFGETAYIGGAQVTGARRPAGQVKCVFEYWDSFDKGRYRIRAIVPVNGVDPTRIRRVDGTGVVALIDTSIAEQKHVVAKRPGPMPVLGGDLGRIVRIPPRPDDHDRHERELSRIREEERARHDNGRHLGWEIGRGNPHRDHEEDLRRDARSKWDKDRDKWLKKHKKDDRDEDRDENRDRRDHDHDRDRDGDRDREYR